MKKGKRVLLFLGVLSLVVVLSACGATGEVNAQSTGLWDRYIVYYFAEAIKASPSAMPGSGSSSLH